MNNKIYNLRSANNFIKKITTLILVIFLIDIISVVLYMNYSDSISKEKPEKTFDCGVVFFHSVKKSGGLSEETMQRCDVSLSLLKEGKIKYIICSGGGRTKGNVTGARLMRNYLKGDNVSDSLILTDTISYSTKTNLEEVNKIMGKNSLKSAILISSPSHLPRIKYISRNYVYEKDYRTYVCDDSIFKIYADCNIEYIKWIYLLFLPDSFSEYSKEIIFR